MPKQGNLFVQRYRIFYLSVCFVQR